LTSESGILLVCMPFGHVFSPSIGLSLLKAGLAERGMSAQIRYFSIRFAELTGRAFYYRLSADSEPSIEDLAGEWVFSRALFGPRAENDDYVDEILGRRVMWITNDPARPVSARFIRSLLRARALADRFLQWCLDEVLRTRPRLVGFTSMFQQHVASLALARLIKQALPETFIVFGGANCEGVMGAETIRQFPFVDAAVSGEADLVFPELARRVLDGRPACGLSGVRTRAGIEAEFAKGRFDSAPTVRDLDALPYPDYGDYFAQYGASRFGRRWRPSIFLETSRGCWWGEKMHCTFCGLNGQTMAFRSKSSRRALDELTCLSERHPGCRVELTDNILDMRYFKDFLPALAARTQGPRLFYEVKANLKKEQLRMLRAANVLRIQPGIESLSDPVLRLMRKGVSALQNIQLLKWCKELGVQPGWNLIWGFPGEPPEEYERMARLVPLLIHLRPPYGSGMIRLDRFSPNFDEARQRGLVDVTPLPPYRYIYPLPVAALANVAYFFTFRYREPRDVKSYVEPLSKQLRRWRRGWLGHDLFSVDTGGYLLVWDLRPARSAPLTVLRGVDRILYQACDRACDLRCLGERLEQDAAGRLPADAIEQRLEPLVHRGLLVRDGSRYLALAVPLGEYSPPARALMRFYDLIRKRGRRVSGGWMLSPDALETGRPWVGSPSVRSRHRKSAASRRAARLTISHFAIHSGGEVMIRRMPGL
jgi:ribosomal peptide maturation radical SAM protein 1